MSRVGLPLAVGAPSSKLTARPLWGPCRRALPPLLQYVLPLPCTPEVLEEVREWEQLNEDEDEDEKMLEYYGNPGAVIQGEVRLHPSNVNPGVVVRGEARQGGLAKSHR